MTRVALAGVLLVSLFGVLASSAAAGTWADAAADPRIGFPVYRPAHELGMRASVKRLPCGADTYYVLASYRRARSRVTLYESAPRCGDPGESMTVKHVRIGGHEVAVNVFCKHAGCQGGVTLADGLRHGFLLFVPHGRIDIEITSTRVHLNALLRLARSLEKITRPKGPWPALHAGDFLSPDGKIWCEMDAGTPADLAWCVTREPQHSGELHRDGSVAVCNAPAVCTEGWGDGAPRLHAGQSSVVGPYRCTGQAASVTCTVSSGAGFTIDAAGVTTLPAATAARTVYFFASPFGTLSVDQLVVRPKGFPIFLDGQWVIEKLHWTHWGAKVARATGISNSSDDKPDAAHGKRIKTKAKVTLSNPGPWHGRTVYRCVSVIVPKPADFGQRRCLKGKGAFAFYG